MESSWG